MPLRDKIAVDDLLKLCLAYLLYKYWPDTFNELINAAAVASGGGKSEGVSECFLSSLPYFEPNDFQAKQFVLLQNRNTVYQAGISESVTSEVLS